MATMRAPRKKKKKTGLIVTLLIILVVIIGAIIGFFTLKNNDSLPLWGDAPVPTIHEGNVNGMALSATPEITTTEGFRTYFQNAITYAKDNNLDTIIFNAKDGLAAYWRDGYFPTTTEVSSQDTSFQKLDPLAILCEEAEGSGIQIWIQVNPYSSTGYEEGMSGKVVKQALANTDTAYSATADSDYSKLLIKSLSRLPHTYPVAGILFTGLDTLPTGISDSTAFDNALTSTLQSIKDVWTEKGYQTKMYLDINTQNSLVNIDTVNSLANANTIQSITANFSTGENFATEIEQWNQAQTPVITVVPQTQSDIVLFVSATAQQYGGAILGNYSELDGNQSTLALLKSTTLDGGTLPTGFDVPKELAVQYPTENQKIYWSQVYVTGSSDPSVPLYLDGVEVENRSKTGVFGVLVELASGNNTFTFTQEGQTDVVRTIVKPTASGSSSSASTEIGSDSTKEAEPGQAVRINTLIASGLTEPNSDSAINETFLQGGVAIVQESVQTTRYNSSKGVTQKTWAYKLTSGDYVLAYNCVWVDSGTSTFTGLSVLPSDSTNPERSEVIQFNGTGTPASYLSYDDQTSQLIISMYDTSFSLSSDFSSDYVQSAKTEAMDNGVKLILTTKDLWGYQMEYDGTTTKLYLKGKPTISSNVEQPLTGTTVMIDAGHGDTDIGAYGILNTEGFYEKDVNLQLAQATAYRLRQMGATVIMTRDDDSFPTLTERLEAQMVQKPDFFIAIHHDAVDPNRDLTDVKGISAYYYHPYNTPPSKQYAENLISAVGDATGRTGKAAWGYYYVTRTTVCPSLLFEYGYLNNPTDFGIVTDKIEIYTAACATADGILATVQQANT